MRLQYKLALTWKRAPLSVARLVMAVGVPVLSLLFLSSLLWRFSVSASRPHGQAGQASPTLSDTWYVSVHGNDDHSCLTSTAPCRHIRTALHRAAAGDVIHVAQGTFTDSLGTVAWVTKSVTLRGGWDAAFVSRDPRAYPTRLDARYAGPVVVLSGPVSSLAITPLIEGFIVTRGNGTGVSGCMELLSPADGGCGGGIFSINAIPHILNNVITANVATMSGQGYGGGIYLQNISSGGLVSGNVIMNNVAALSDTGQVVVGYGGGVNLYFATTMLQHNLIAGNRAAVGDGYGGGVRLRANTSTLYSNTIQYNIASVATSSATLGHGGGVHVIKCDIDQGPAIMDNVLQGNIASIGGQGTGGGIRLANTYVRILGNWIISNTASFDSDRYGNGGGVYAKLGRWTLRDNQVFNNVCTTNGPVGFGGGFQLEDGHAVVEGNLFVGNVARVSAGPRIAYGGGLNLLRCSGLVRHNVLRENTVSPLIAGNAGYGGGLSIRHNPATGDPVKVEGNYIAGNQSPRLAGGVWVFGVYSLTLTNNIIVDNIAAEHGGGMYITGDAQAPAGVRLVHNTLFDNSRVGAGEGIYLAQYATLSMTNNIVVSHSYGIFCEAGTAVGTLWAPTARYTLFYSNAISDTAGPVMNLDSITGDPHFLAADEGDFHIQGASAALDKGTSTFVTQDFDGDRRPIGQRVDVGADEIGTRGVRLGKSQRVETTQVRTLTYTHPVTNVGDYTDTLDLAIDASWPGACIPPTVTLGPSAGRPVIISLTIPQEVEVGTVQPIALTATSMLNLDVLDSVQDLVDVIEIFKIYLPMITRNASQTR